MTVDSVSTFAQLENAARPLGLMVMGAVDKDAPQAEGGLVLLGAAADFWTRLNAAPEGRDRAPDPVDRYSRRVVSALAKNFGARPRFPFGGPPYEPFIAWAKRSGRAWSSPTGMLVHDVAGLMISYRGALAFPHGIAAPNPTGASPCDTCADRPCATACPVGALAADHAYDVPACHGFLDSQAGAACLETGCAARRACPVSQAFGRDPAQSRHHMRAFHPS